MKDFLAPSFRREPPEILSLYFIPFRNDKRVKRAYLVIANERSEVWRSPYDSAMKKTRLQRLTARNDGCGLSFWREAIGSKKILSLHFIPFRNDKRVKRAYLVITNERSEVWRSPNNGAMKKTRLPRLTARNDALLSF